VTHLYEHPRVKSPGPFSFLCFFLVPPFSCSTAPQAFARPDRVLSQAGARRISQGWPACLAGHPQGLAFTELSKTARLDGSGVDYTPLSLIYPSTCRRRGVIPITDVSFGRSCYEVHGACDNRINLYPAAPIRLAKVLLAWTIAQEGWGSSSERHIGKCQFAMWVNSHTSDLPDTPDWGCRNSVRYRVRVAPCGTRPCSR